MPPDLSVLLDPRTDPLTSPVPAIGAKSPNARTSSSEEPNGEETVAGVDPESTPLVVFAIVTSLLLAAGCWFRPDWRWLLVATAFAMAAFAVLDLRELIHQLDESNTGLAVQAGAVAILHGAAAVTAVILRRRSIGREALAAA